MVEGRSAPGWDFFVSYTQADLEWAVWIAWVLEEAGYRVLVQAWDMVPGSNWTDRMDEGVRLSARTIAVVSAEYQQSVFGKPEWRAAWAADPLGEQRKLVPVRVDGEWPPGLLRGVVGIDLVGVSEPDARRRVLDGVTAARDGRAKPAKAPGFPGRGRAVRADPGFPRQRRSVFSVPPRNPNFTGRGAELERVRGSLVGGGAVTVQALRGMAGVGKTQTVIEYAYRHAGDYELVWWVNAEQPTLITEQLAALSSVLGLPADLAPDDAVRAVRAALRDRAGWLLIFDNAEDPAQLRAVLPGGSGHVLVTTRRGGFGYLGAVLDLDVLPRDQAVALLRRRAPGVADDLADELAEVLGDLPLALEQAASYLDQTGMPAEEYLQLLRTRAPDMFGRGRVLDHTDTIATLWSLTLDRLCDAHPAAVQLATICAYLAPEPIPLDLVTGQVEHLPAPLSEVAADPAALADTIGVLLDYSLARRTTTDLLFHRLTQTVLRHPNPTNTAPADPSPLLTALTLLRTDLPTQIIDAPQNWPRWRQLLPHVLTTTRHHPDTTPIAADTTAWLLDRAATYQQTHGQPAAAQPLLERALRIREASYGPDHPEVATSLNNLAWVLRDLGQSAQARPLLERALRIDEASYGPDHPEVATSLNNLAWVLSDLGQSAQARPLHERALRIDEASYGPDHPRVAASLSHLAWVLSDLGQPAQVRPLHERALRIFEASYGPDHPHVATSLSHLAWVLSDLGQSAQARPLLERALRIYEASYGPDHPATRRSREWLRLLSGGTE